MTPNRCKVNHLLNGGFMKKRKETKIIPLEKDKAYQKVKPIMPEKRPKYSFYDEEFVRLEIKRYFNDKEYQYLIQDEVDHAVYNLRQEYATAFEDLKHVIFKTMFPEKK